MRKRRARQSDDKPPHGRGTGVPDPVDVHVGARIRARRMYLEKSQEALAQTLGVTFQQVQKYESAANRVSASRLAEIAEALGVDEAYFYVGLPQPGASGLGGSNDWRARMLRPETIELIRLYYQIPDGDKRRDLLQMIKSVASAQRRDAG